MIRYSILNNIKFQAASPKNKRRMIAEDVIRQLNLGRYTAYSAYVSPSGDNNCKVCGIGACLVSMHKIKSMGSQSFYDITIKGKWYELEKHFGVEQLAIIEDFFEHPHHEISRPFTLGETTYPCTFGGMFKHSETSWEKIKLFNESKRYFRNITPTQRMRQIMENIVRNGEFDPVEEIEFQTNLLEELKEDAKINDLSEMAKSFKNDMNKTKVEEQVITIE